MCICFNMHSPYLWIALVNKDIQSWQFNFFIIYLFISPTVWQSARGSTKKKYKYFYFIHKLWLFVVLLYIYVFSWFPRGAQAHKRKTKGEYLPIDDLLAKRIFDTYEIKLEIYEARNPNIFIFNHMHTYTYTYTKLLRGAKRMERGISGRWTRCFACEQRPHHCRQQKRWTTTTVPTTTTTIRNNKIQKLVLADECAQPLRFLFWLSIFFLFCVVFAFVFVAFEILI